MTNTEKPNIILFMMDQLAAKWLEAAGDGIVPTPNFDRLRAMGTTFTNTISSCPLCSPSRATLATGLSVRNHGVFNNSFYLDESLPTFMKLLQDSGWRTAAFGKFHFRPHFMGLHPDYLSYGFDEQSITEDARGGEWLDWVRSEHSEHFNAVLSTIWARNIPDWKSYGPENEDLTELMNEIPLLIDRNSSAEWAKFGMSQKELSKRKKSVSSLHGCYELPFPEEVSQTNWITMNGTRFIKEATGPWFAQISFVQPHTPYTPPPGYLEHVDTSRIPDPLSAEWKDDPLGPACFSDTMGFDGEISPKWKDERHHYFADIHHLDKQMGVVLDTLQETGQHENTYIIVLADHGEMLHDHGMKGKGEVHYDASIRVPLIVSGPGLESGQVRDEIIQLEDIFPTVLEMAGLPLPEARVINSDKQYESFPGCSLVPICRGEEIEEPREYAYVGSYNNMSSSTPANWARTIRDAEWRYTYYPIGKGEQLFNLEEDPDEQVNLAGDPEYANTRLEMRDRLLEAEILQGYPYSPRSFYAFGVH